MVLEAQHQSPIPALTADYLSIRWERCPIYRAVGLLSAQTSGPVTHIIGAAGNRLKDRARFSTSRPPLGVTADGRTSSAGDSAWIFPDGRVSLPWIGAGMTGSRGDIRRSTKAAKTVCEKPDSRPSRTGSSLRSLSFCLRWQADRLMAPSP